MNKIIDLIKKNKLEIIVFVAGCIEMSLELVAARTFSPHVGSSTLVWTIIIGMILIFMSVGYAVGGKLADKHHDIRSLSRFLMIAGMFISLIPILEVIVLQPLSKVIPSLEVTAFICSVIMFGIPCMILAAISPYAVKLKEIETTDKNSIGRISGRMSAVSTIGCIIGTFLTGFVLIPLIGAKAIVLSSSIILLVLNLLLSGFKSIKKVIVNLFLILSACVIFAIGIYSYNIVNNNIIKEVDSRYGRIQVIKRTLANGQEVKYIKVGPKGAESIIYDNGTIGTYTYFFDLPKYYYKNYSKSLLIGGAAYTYPTYFYSDERNKDIKMDVVEIDPVMTEIAVSEFDLDLSNPSLKNITQDARSYINFTDEKYDAIFMDAFKGDEVPFELTTIQCVHKMKDMLNENGVIIVNLLSAVEGAEEDFLHHEYATYKACFDDVKVYKVHKEVANDEYQNIELIAFKGNIDANDEYKYLIDNLAENEVIGFETNYSISTDDIAPIGN